MNFIKLSQGVMVGAFFSGIILAACLGLITINSDTTGELGLNESGFWWLASILGFSLGFISGGLVGGIVTKFQLGLLNSLLLSFIYGLSIIFIIAIWLGGGWSNSISYSLIVIVIVQLINGVLVSILFVTRNR